MTALLIYVAAGVTLAVPVVMLLRTGSIKTSDDELNGQLAELADMLQIEVIAVAAVAGLTLSWPMVPLLFIGIRLGIIKREEK